MKLFKTIDKVLARMGNMRAMERTHVDTFTESKMENIPGEQIAVSQHGGIWAGVQELNGYLFLNTIILGTTKVKTLKGASLVFSGETQIEVKSDNYEIDSDYSNVSHRWITQISFEITKQDLNFIKKRKYDQVLLNFKKKSVVFGPKK